VPGEIEARGGKSWALGTWLGKETKRKMSKEPGTEFNLPSSLVARSGFADLLDCKSMKEGNVTDCEF